MEWQPIETAPKNGTVVIGRATSVVWNLFDIHAMHWEGEAWWRNNGGCFTSQFSNPSHWIPMPEMPEQEELATSIEGLLPMNRSS